MDETRKKTEQIINEVHTAINDVLARHGMTAEMKGCKFTSRYIIPNIHISKIERDKHGRLVTADPVREAYRTKAGHGKYADLSPAWLDEWFNHRGKFYRVVGLLVRARKYPVRVIQRAEDGTDGDVYVYPIAVVAKAFTRSE